MVHYQVGGSLASQASSYITRQADTELYTQLKAGQLCYVFNARQMGKSSLLVQTRARLQKEGYRCSFIDVTSIGSEQITPLQWYRGMLYSLYEGFDLSALDDALDLEDWLGGQQSFSLLQQLTHLIDQILHVRLPDQNLIIFIDEIDSILTLPFEVDDFFALIRYCYNQRAIDPAYDHLTFALFGVATPADLIQDPRRTPFNIGCPIELAGFTFAEAQGLSQGFALAEGNPDAVLKAILDWTNGQPFLTQKLCRLVLDVADESLEGIVTVPPGTEEFWVENLVGDRLLTHWQAQDEPEHLRTIRNRLLSNPDTAGRLLGLYQQVLTDQRVLTDDAPEQTALLLSGLVIKAAGQLQVKNRIYRAVFSLDWVDQQLANLRPYAPLLAAWVESGQQDDSRLLRGKALQDAQDWSQGKQLSDLDYQYLAASVESDRRTTQKALKAEYLQGRVRLQRRVITVITGALVTMAVLGAFTFWQYRQARRSAQAAIRSEIEALIAASNGNYNANQGLDATVNAIRAAQELNKLEQVTPNLRYQGLAALRQSIYTGQEYNRVLLRALLLDVVVSPDGSRVAIASHNGQITLLHPSGEQLRRINAHEGTVRKLAFSPNGNLLASVGPGGSLKLWQADGERVAAFTLENSELINVSFSPDGQYLATTQQDGFVKIWRLDGTPVATLPNSLALDFSADGRWLVTAGQAAIVQLWTWSQVIDTENAAPQPSQTFPVLANQAAIAQKIVVSPDRQTLGIYIPGQGVQVWPLAGTDPLATFEVELSSESQLQFTPDGQTLVMATTDNELLFGALDGTIVEHLRGHQATIMNVALTPEGDRLISTGLDGSVRFWQLKNPFRQELVAHQGVLLNTLDAAGNQIATGSAEGGVRVWQRQGKGLFSHRPHYDLAAHQSPLHDVHLSPTGQRWVSIARDGQVKLWGTGGELIQTLQLPRGILSVALSPDQQWLAVGGSDGKIYLGQQLPNGLYPTQPQVLAGHPLTVRDLAFSSDSQWLLSGSADKTVKVWQVSSQRLVQTLTGHGAEVWGVAISPDGQWLASASADQTVRLWRPDGTLVQTMTGHQGAVADVVFGTEGQTLWSIASDGTANRWDLQGRLLWSLPHEPFRIVKLSIDADEETLVASGIGPEFWVWSLPQVLETDELTYACDWVNDYLTHNAPAGDRDICNGVGEQ